MKVKTSISLEETTIQKIDREAELKRPKCSRSAIINDWLEEKFLRNGSRRRRKRAVALA